MFTNVLLITLNTLIHYTTEAAVRVCVHTVYVANLYTSVSTVLVESDEKREGQAPVKQ